MHKNVYRKQAGNIFLLPIIIFMVMGCGNNNDQSAENTGTTKDTSGSSSHTLVDLPRVTPDTTSVSSAETNADWLLVPGISAGQTKIGENAEEVYKRLGTPDGGDAAMQKAVAIWYSNHDSTTHSIAIYTARSTDSAAIARILQIRVTSPSFVTKDSIHAGSTLSDIQSKYTVKQTETYKDAGANYKVYDSKEGIAFELNGSGKCVAIIIHKGGITGEGTYLKFRTTNKFLDKK